MYVYQLSLVWKMDLKIKQSLLVMDLEDFPKESVQLTVQDNQGTHEQPSQKTQNSHGSSYTVLRVKHF